MEWNGSVVRQRAIAPRLFSRKCNTPWRPQHTRKACRKRAGISHQTSRGHNGNRAHQNSIIGPDTYRIYNNCREYSVRNFARVVGVPDAAYELVMLAAIQTTDDGEDEDGKYGDDDARQKSSV